MNTETILKGTGLRKRFPVKKGVMMLTSGWVHALDRFDFSLGPGETIGIVGESGCGKTTLGRIIARILDGEGSLEYTDRDGRSYQVMGRLDRERELSFRRDVQMIFQDPYSSLDPRMKIGRILREPLEAHGLLKTPEETRRQLAELLERVGLHSDAMDKYPHEFSGGQRQRIAIARALALKPRVIICDEPTSALDVSVQSQVINLLREIQSAECLSYIFISHNLDLVRHVSDGMYVIYLGRVVESGDSEKIFDDPVHPYTKALLASVPEWDPEKRKLLEAELPGEPPSPLWTPPGCPFEPRCPLAKERCRVERPETREIRDRNAACHFA